MSVLYILHILQAKLQLIRLPNRNLVQNLLIGVLGEAPVELTPKQSREGYSN